MTRLTHRQQQQSQIRDRVTDYVTAAIMLVLVLPVLAVVVGLSWRLMRWVAG